MTTVELRALDAEVHRGVFGCQVHWSEDHQDWRHVIADNGVSLFCGQPVPHYSTDMGAAWKVVEKMCGETKQILFVSGEWYAIFPRSCPEGVVPTVILEGAATAPLAICKAALAAAKGV